MHEYSLVQSLLDQVDSIRSAQGADRVVSVHVSIGTFSGVEPELFRAAFEVLVDVSAARGARLEMTTTPLESRCDQCQHPFAVNRFHFRCPVCGERDVTVTRGEDLVLETVVLEQIDEERNKGSGRKEGDSDGELRDTGPKGL